MQLRLSASNFLHRNYVTSNEQIIGGVDQLAIADAKTYPSWVARLEIKF